MSRRPPRSTPLYSSAASDVYKRQGRTGPSDSRKARRMPRRASIDRGVRNRFRSRTGCTPTKWIADAALSDGPVLVGTCPAGSRAANGDASHRPHSPGGGAERELASVEVEVLGRVAEQLAESHVLAEERVPAGGVVHAARQLPGVCGKHALLQPVDHSIELAPHPV